MKKYDAEIRYLCTSVPDIGKSFLPVVLTLIAEVKEGKRRNWRHDVTVGVEVKLFYNKQL
jgi:hypothetical protein